MSRLNLWLLVGFFGQSLFTARFVVQWLASERECDSVVPVAFWWLSLLGGGALLSYAIFRRDPVIVVGQAMGLMVYVRNLMLVAQANRLAGRRTSAIATSLPMVGIHSQIMRHPGRCHGQPDTEVASEALPRSTPLSR